MEERKTNWILIEAVILLIVAALFGGIAIGKNMLDKNNSTEKNNSNNKDANEKLVKEEIDGLIEILNDKSDKNDTCSINLLATDYVDSYFLEHSNENFWDYFGPIVMNCGYKEEYKEIFDGEYTTYKLMDSSQYQKYQEYFNNNKKLELFENSNYVQNKECNDCEDGTKYFNQNYYLAYTHGDGFGATETSFKLENIEKDKDYYNVTIIASGYSGKYRGTFRTEVINKHLKYNRLTFEKA